jgi:hypothetical protein
VRGCVFPLYPDGNQPMEWVVELAQEDQLPLIEALRADPDVFEANTSEALAFSYDVTDDGGHTVMVPYVFLGDAWIIDLDGVKFGVLTASAVRNLITSVTKQNPDVDFPLATDPPKGYDATCAAADAKTATQRYGLILEPYDIGGTDYPWSLDDESTIAAAEETFDPCAELSSITVTVEGGTVSSPSHIMLFHHGDYLGTASSEAYGFWPSTERLDDGSIQVTYTYPLPDESNAAASGRAVSVFTWNDSTQGVDHTGEFPPQG